MPIITIKELLDVGVHFGHKVSRWNPKMAKYIIKRKNKILIINLKKTIQAIAEARSFLKEMALQGKTILFVGTKRQASSAVEEEAKRCGMPYVNYRWLGGFLTNREVIIERIGKYHELVDLEDTDLFGDYSKKQVARHNREKGRILKNLSGVMELDKLPDILLVIGVWDERIAIAEARKLKIPVVAIGDTDCDPDLVDCCIPANDESFRAVKLILSKLTDAIIDGIPKAVSKDDNAPEAGSEEKVDEDNTEE